MTRRLAIYVYSMDRHVDGFVYKVVDQQLAIAMLVIYFQNNNWLVLLKDFTMNNQSNWGWFCTGSSLWYYFILHIKPQENILIAKNSMIQNVWMKCQQGQIWTKTVQDINKNVDYALF